MIRKDLTIVSLIGLLVSVAVEIGKRSGVVDGGRDDNRRAIS